MAVDGPAKAPVGAGAEEDIVGGQAAAVDISDMRDAGREDGPDELGQSKAETGGARLDETGLDQAGPGGDLNDGPETEMVAALDEDTDGQGKQEEIKLTPSQALVEIIRLLSQSPEHKYMFLAELEWAIIPPVRLGQFRLFHKEGRVVGFVTWAMVNEAVEARLKRGVRRLRPDEWKCGERRVVVDVIGGPSHDLDDV